MTKNETRKKSASLPSLGDLNGMIHDEPGHLRTDSKQTQSDGKTQKTNE
eukprot:CAMPEP_0206278884 /NCGR_PEP_ID=MMETSP0047_2-20121206/37699_1 /ASSEMBLY_ACC=CAM_ASM_000192 /TAXON_ID=195065 /ORGANISM="Chroomonas mesostigmatica_cf, Strain CCMP1168" /LENGTH=48 /DNA_ID= /DNA_START= /DNA_END= /DNA_ORIENTATION=